MLTNCLEVAQRKQRLQSRGVLGKATVSNLRKTELTLGDSKPILNLRPNSGFDSLCCVTQLSRGRFQVQHSALARHLVASCQYRTDVSASLGGAELQVA
jgi:hypothetical protein